jgi:hypothetical protein
MLNYISLNNMFENDIITKFVLEVLDIPINDDNSETDWSNWNSFASEENE